MKFEEFQKEWQSVKIEPKSHDELRRMMYAPRTSRGRNFQRKEILKWSISALVGLALWALITYFKGWANPVCIMLGVLVILNHHMALSTLWWLPEKNTLRKTIVSHLSRIKVALLLSRLVGVAVFLVAAFLIATRTNQEPLSTVALGLATLLLIFLVSWWSSRKWARKIADLKAVLKKIDENPQAVGTQSFYRPGI